MFCNKHLKLNIICYIIKIERKTTKETKNERDNNLRK